MSSYVLFKPNSQIFPDASFKAEESDNLSSEAYNATIIAKSKKYFTKCENIKEIHKS
jgi:hypothetical protein